VKVTKSNKEGYYTWVEFLEFFLTKDLKPHEKGEGTEWWNFIDNSGKLIGKESEQGGDEFDESRFTINKQS
jgi:hypothetical protein